MTPTARRLADTWLLVIIASTVAAIVASMVASGSAFTTVPLLWFLAVCPGMAYVRMLGGATTNQDMAMRWITAIGLSLALDAIVAEALLYTHTYTGLRTVAVLGAVASAGAVIGRLRARAESEPTDAPVGSPN